MLERVKCGVCNREVKLKGKLKNQEEQLAFECCYGHQRTEAVSGLKYGRALKAVAETGEVRKFIDALTAKPEKVKETYSLEVWIPNKEKPGYLKWERNRRRREVIEAVTKKLKEVGYHDGIEWISPSAWLEENKEIPRFDEMAVWRHQGKNEGEKVEVGVVTYGKKQGEPSVYFGVLSIKLFDKDLAREITDFLTDYLEA